MRTTTPSSLSKPPPEPVHHQGRTPLRCLLLTQSGHRLDIQKRPLLIHRRHWPEDCHVGSLPDAPARASKSSVILPHEAIEEGRKLRVGIERQDVGNILVRSHDDHAAAVSIDTAHIENVVAAFQVGTEHLLVVTKRIAALPGQEKRWHSVDCKFAMTLLEDCPDIDHAVDVCTVRSVFPDGRLL